ncbi:MAG: FadR family transcriptional regulator [Anaerolineae bacterium]|nr:FadR family transcriptional regulator [Anaerolineae bacterium]
MEPSSYSSNLKRQTLAEQLAETLREAILAGRWRAGEALPTEPELAAQFGVSRAVVRDGTRMLAAQGLVEAQHGRGVFVTASPVAAFGDALLLALRRAGATTWDVERFEQMVMPEVQAEAARQATDADLAEIQRLAEAYHATFAAVTRDSWGRDRLSAAERDRVMVAFRALYGAIFAATHNALWGLLAEPLLRLRAPRSWQSGEMTVEEFIAHERQIINARVAAIVARDPARAHDAAKSLLAAPPDIEAALRDALQATPVGEIADIPLPLPAR